MIKTGWNWKWFLRGLRLSLLVGFGMAGVQVWEDYDRYQAEVIRNSYTQQGYECAAKLNDKVLLAAENAYGTIDVKPLGCADRSFIVRLDEIQRVRTGVMDFPVYARPVYAENVMISFLAGAILTVMLTLLMLGGINLARWVWGR